MSNKPRAFLFDADAWLSSYTVERMSGEQVKAYLYLLARSWTELPTATLPNDDFELAKMARVSPEKWEAIKPLILAQFSADDHGRIYHPRLRESAKYLENRVYAGKSGWTTKRKKKQSAVGKDNITNLKQFR